MKISFIISLSLFRIFFSIQYIILYDGIDKNITHTRNKNYDRYYFESNIAKSKGIIFTVKTPYGCRMSSTLEIYEYEYSRGYRETYRENNFRGKMISRINTCEYSYLYTISSPLSRHVDFETSFRDYTNSAIITARIDIINERFDLFNKKTLDLFNLSLNTSYYLYLEYFDSSDFTFLINNMTQKPFSNITFHEFGSINNSIRVNAINKQMSFKINNNQTLASFSYTASSNYTKYLILQIKPSLNIAQMSAKFEYSLTIFNLNEGIWKTIDNVVKNEIYLFFVEATESAKINISLIINNTVTEYDEYELPIILNNGTIIQPYPKSDSIPNYIDINVYEYEKNNNSYISYIQKSTKRLNKEREIYFMTRTYMSIISPLTKYCAFSFKPNFNINHMRVNINISGGLFDLLNNTSNNINNLRSDGDYYFFTKVHRFNFIRLVFTMNNYKLTTNPFSYIYYYQLSYRNSYQSYRKYEQSISPIINDKQIIISHNVSGDSTNYIYFRIKPTYYIEKTNIKVEVTDCLIDLDNYKYAKGIYYYLKKDYTYYIKMNAWIKHKTTLNLKFYNMNNIPFSFIKIHECFYPYFMSQWTKNITKQIAFKKKDNVYELTFEKKNTLNKHLFLYIEITPENYINYMVAEAKISKNFKIDDITSIILIIVEIIIFIIMILYIIIHFKKCKLFKSKSKYLSLNSLDVNNQNEIMPQN